MATKADFTKEQWELLLDVPPAAGTAVMYAGQSGLGSVKEALALASGVLGARHGYDGIELIESLANARTKDGEKSSIETLSSPYRGVSNKEIVEDAVGKCSQVAALLAEKCTEPEREAFVDWTLTVAEKVANAAKEGGFLGIGGERVSAEEKQVLKAIRRALMV